MSEFRSFDGVTLHYDVEGDGPPAVLLHGFTANTELNWRAPGIMRALAEAGRQAIGLDARGHGRSEKCYDPAAYANEAMVRDVGALFDHLGLERADVLGYSMGAATAMRFALTDGRVRRLVLGGSGGNPGGGLEDTAEELAERGRRIGEALETDNPYAIADPLARRFRRFADAIGADRRALAAIQRGRRRVPLTAADVSRIGVPTLVICGDEDRSPHELAAALPAGQASVVPGDHFSAVQSPAFAEEIVRFLSEGP